MAQVDTVVFDLGGVLIDWKREYLYEQLIADPDERSIFLDTVCTLAWNHEMDAGRHVPTAVAELAVEHPEHRDLILAWWDQWPEMLGGEIDGTMILVDRLLDEGVPIYALTNWAAETWPFAVERFPFLRTAFEGIVVSGHEGVAKPDEEIYDILRSRYALDPRRTAYVDDSEPNVATAERLGYPAHHFTGATGLEAWLGSLGIV